MRKRFTHILVFLLPAVLALMLGRLAHDRALVDLDTVAAMGNAWRVFHWQTSANMALIGFDQPPAMALLFVPFAAFAPQSLVSGLAAPIVGAVFLGLSVLIIWRLSCSLGLPWWLALMLCAAFTLHPLVLSYATLGSRAMVLTFVLLGLSASLVSWQRDQRVRDVLTASFFAAAAVLLAVETLAVVVAAALYLVACCLREPARTPGKAEGLLVAFLMPAAYVALVWVGANWAIMGNPWHFWPTEPEGLEHQMDGLQLLSCALAMGLAANPLLLALLFHGLRSRLAGVTAPAAYLLLAAFVATFAFHHLALVPTDGGVPWSQQFALVSAALGVGGALLVALLAQLAEAARAGALRRVLSPGLVLVLFGSVFVALTQPEHLPARVRSVLAGRPAFAADVRTEWALADRLKSAWDPALPHLLWGQRAFVVALRAEARQNVEVLDGHADPRTVPLRVMQGSVLTLPYDTYDAEVAARLRPLVLAPRWQAGGGRWPDWTVYQLCLARAPANGQPSSPGAIIAPGTPHAHSRR